MGGWPSGSDTSGNRIREKGSLRAPFSFDKRIKKSIMINEDQDREHGGSPARGMSRSHFKEGNKMAEKHPLQWSGGTEGEDMTIRSYSGRGMYGKTCLAITGDIDPIEIGFYLAKTSVMENEDFPPTKQNSMGLSIVLYWPRVPYVEEDEEIEEEA